MTEIGEDMEIVILKTWFFPYLVWDTEFFSPQSKENIGSLKYYVAIKKYL
jgi:hypothetical protein